MISTIKSLGSNVWDYFKVCACERYLFNYVFYNQGGRYALLLVVPRSRDGLTRLTADLPAVPMSEIQDILREEELLVSLPTFYIETTTKPVAALAKVGYYLQLRLPAFNNYRNYYFLHSISLFGLP